MSALTDYFTSLANKIRSKTGSSSTMTPTEMVDEVDSVYSAGQANPPTQTKTATPTTSSQDITPDSGKFLSKVTVNAIQTQTKSATPSTTAQTITPDSGKFLSSVSVGAIQTQEKTAPNQSYSSILSVTPDSGKYLSKVNIPKAFGGDATALASSSMKSATATSSSGAIPFSESNLSKGLYIAIFPWFGNGIASVTKTNVNQIGSASTGTVTSNGDVVAHIGALVLESLGNGSFTIAIGATGAKRSSTVNWFLIKLSD